MLLNILHTSLLVHDLQVALAFYGDLLGLTLIDRPDLGYPGAWLQVGRQQIHLLQLPNPDAQSVRPGHVGWDRHVALGVVGLAVLEQRLRAAGVSCRMSNSGRQALFCRDPDGNGLEFIELP